MVVLFVDDRRWGWADLATGALMLTRPNVYLVALILIVLAGRRAGWRSAARAAAAILLLVVGGLTSW